MNTFIDGIIRGSGKELQTDWTFSQTLVGFYHAVNWNQKWLQAVLVGHVVLLALVLWTRKRFHVQIGLFLFICAAVYVSETLNSFGQHNWRTFADQDYFDPHGVFMCTVYAAPLLVVGLVQLVSLLVEVSQMVIRTKREELRRAIRRKAKQS